MKSFVSTFILVPVAITDGTSFPAKATLSIYAPQMYPVLGSLATVKDVATRISEVIQRDSVGSQSLTDSVSYAESKTWGLSVSLNGGGSSVN